MPVKMTPVKDKLECFTPEELNRERARRLKIWQSGGRAGPIKIDIELHRRCNLLCLSCSRRNDSKYPLINEFSETIEMPKERWLDLVDEAAQLGVLEWHIAGGGEPMYLPDVTWPVMQRIKHHGMYGIVTTNGTLWDEEKIKGLVGMGWDRIHFSIDGPDAGTHDTLRGVPGTFERACDTVRKLCHYKNKLKSEKPMININTVLSVFNYRKLPEMVRFAHSIGAEYLFVEPLIVYSEIGRRMKLRERHILEFQSYLQEAKKLATELNLDTNFSSIKAGNLDEGLIEQSSQMHRIVRKDAKNYKESILAWTCYDPWFHMSIKADGLVTHCDVANDGCEYVRGKKLQKIWFGEYFQRHREIFMKGQIREYCSQCNPSHTTQRRWLRELIERKGGGDVQV